MIIIGLPKPLADVMYAADDNAFYNLYLLPLRRNNIVRVVKRSNSANA